MKVSKILKLIFVLSIPLLSVDIDIDKASMDANKTKKHVMLFLHKDNCGYCERMIFQLDSKKIKKITDKNFIILDINKDDNETVAYKDFNGTNEEFIRALGVDFFPTLVFINGCANKIIYDVVGFRNSKKLITILNYVSSKSYKKMSFEDFRDELFFDE